MWAAWTVKEIAAFPASAMKKKSKKPEQVDSLWYLPKDWLRTLNELLPSLSGQDDNPLPGKRQKGGKPACP